MAIWVFSFVGGPYDGVPGSERVEDHPDGPPLVFTYPDGARYHCRTCAEPDRIIEGIAAVWRYDFGGCDLGVRRRQKRGEINDHDNRNDSTEELA